jgi:hypothetical protein
MHAGKLFEEKQRQRTLRCHAAAQSVYKILSRSVKPRSGAVCMQSPWYMRMHGELIALGFI